MSPLEKKLKEIGVKRVIVAIEKGNLRDLPEPFYIKALISKYAKAIGAVANWDYEKLKQEELNLASQKSQQIKKNSHQGSSRSSHATIAPVAHKNKSRGSKGFQLKSAHLYMIYMLLVAVAIKTITSFVEQPVIVNNQAVPKQDVSLNEDKVPLIGNVPTTISSASPSQFVSQSSSNDSESVVVDIDLKERCWLKVVVDGKVKFEGTLAKGSKRSWQGKEQINIIAGNAGGVVVTYNHGKEKILGKPGQVQEVTYTVN